MSIHLPAPQCCIAAMALLGCAWGGTSGSVPSAEPTWGRQLPPTAAPVQPWCEQVGCSSEEAACLLLSKALFALILGRELVLWVTYGVRWS